MIRRLFDPHCRDLAEYFLTDIGWETTDDIDELAAMIQDVCDGYCNRRDAEVREVKR
jgi:hypothetical protein